MCEKKMTTKYLLLVLSLISHLSLFSCTSPPHIVFMLVDDWGWANVGYHRDPPTPEVVTPNIDGLVKQGLELDQHYVFRVCSPSRSSFLSGRLPINVNDDNGDPNRYNPKDPVSGFQGIPRNMTVIAEKLKAAGYATHQVGKWDAGMATPTHTPLGRGFDSSLCYFHHANDYYNETAGRCEGQPIVDLWENTTPAFGLNKTGPDGYEEGLFRERFLKIVMNHDPSQPLFLYYASHAIHKPYEVPESYLNKFKFIDWYNRQIYHAMVTYVDDNVGALVDALKQKGMWDNVLFVASSDNGGPITPGAGANNYPLKGGKTTDWQGGVRVNAFVSGGYLPESMRGKKTEGYIHIADWYATFCSLAGVDPTDQKAAKANLPPIDSMNMWPMISGQNSTSPRVDLPVTNTTLISGDYKILTGDKREAGWTGPHSPNSTQWVNTTAHCGDGCLYNIKMDPYEYHNLASEKPDILKMMQMKLAAYQAKSFNPDRGHVWPGACEAAVKKYGSYWGPFLD